MNLISYVASFKPNGPGLWTYIKSQTLYTADGLLK